MARPALCFLHTIPAGFDPLRMAILARLLPSEVR